MRFYISFVFALLLFGCGEQTPDETQLESLDQAVLDRLPVMMDAYDVDGMVVVAVSGQRTLLSKGYGVTLDGKPYTSDTPCPIYSATKVLTSLTFASLVEDGEFDVNARLGDQLPDAPEAWADIPFWRLLNHTSGIPMIVNKPEFQTLAADPSVGNDDI